MKIVLIGVAVGLANLAQAATITVLSAGNTIVGTSSYIYQESIAKGTQIASADIRFNNIELTVSGGIPNTLFYDLINGNFVTKTVSSPESYTDYFQTTSPYKGISDSLGSKTFYAPGTGGTGKSYYDTETWTYTFAGQALTDLQNDVFNKGYFDIGLDPNCHYLVNGFIDFDYTTSVPGGSSVPDPAMTAGLLGMSLLGLAVLRRKSK